VVPSDADDDEEIAMPMNLSRKQADASNPDAGIGPAGHCLILCLIALAAIAASLLVSSREAEKHPAAVQATRASVVSTSGNAVQPGETREAAPAQRFEYFPAQFPTPSGEVGEQAPTF
jgi:hypothetical protein